MTDNEYREKCNGILSAAIKFAAAEIDKLNPPEGDLQQLILLRSLEISSSACLKLHPRVDKSI